MEEIKRRNVNFVDTVGMSWWSTSCECRIALHTFSLTEILVFYGAVIYVP